MKQVYRELTQKKQKRFFNQLEGGELLSFSLGFFILILILLMSVLSFFQLPPYQPIKTSFSEILKPPSAKHWLGTDGGGRDTLSLLMAGTHAYLLPGVVAISISLGFGTIFGAFAGFYGGWIKSVMNYVADTMGSFQRVILILMAVSILKINPEFPEIRIYYIMIVIGILNIPKVANLIENKFQTLANTGFIEADKALGFGSFRIIFDYILWRNCSKLLIVQATYGLSDVILIETTLSYLGIGVQEPIPSWGNMVAAGREVFLEGNFLPASVPAVTIMFAVFGLHQAGDTLTRLLNIQD